MQPLPYVFQEFPKWVTPENGVPCVVQNAEQEAAVMAPVEKSSAPAKTEKDALRHEAAALGIEVDGRWSADRIKSEIEAVQAAQQQEPEQ